MLRRLKPQLLLELPPLPLPPLPLPPLMPPLLPRARETTMVSATSEARLRRWDPATATTLQLRRAALGELLPLPLLPLPPLMPPLLLLPRARETTMVSATLEARLLRWDPATATTLQLRRAALG
jgi:hypothetical protein